MKSLYESILDQNIDVSMEKSVVSALVRNGDILAILNVLKSAMGGNFAHITKGFAKNNLTIDEFQSITPKIQSKNVLDHIQSILNNPHCNVNSGSGETTLTFQYPRYPDWSIKIEDEKHGAIIKIKRSEKDTQLAKLFDSIDFKR